MGCRWATVRGHRVRVGGVTAPRPILNLGVSLLVPLMRGLGIRLLALSPELTIEELKDAIFRLWLDPEKGYFVEARLRPGAPPLYHAITPAEARALEVGRPSPDFLARMFHLEEAPTN